MLFEFGSVVVEVTEAVFVIVVGVLVFVPTTRLTVAFVPLLIVPKLQLNAPFEGALQVPCDEPADTNATPVGSVSVKLTLLAF